MSIRPVEEIDDLVQVRNVFCSVTDKTDLSYLALGLIETVPEIRIFSTGGTFEHLSNEFGPELASRHLTEVSKYTGMPETKGGLVKSLHHKLFLGYLTETYCPGHQDDMKREGAVPIDLVIINLYNFEKAAIADGDPVKLELARGNIDVGGPSALRAAAKDWLRVMILPEVEDYEIFLSDLAKNKGATSYSMRYYAAVRTFGILSAYDGAINSFFSQISHETTMRAYKTIHNRRNGD